MLVGAEGGSATVGAADGAADGAVDGAALGLSFVAGAVAGGCFVGVVDFTSSSDGGGGSRARSTGCPLSSADITGSNCCNGIKKS